MMATATSPSNSLGIGRESYVLPASSMSYYRLGEASPTTQDKLKVKKRRFSPPRLPPPPPPPYSGKRCDDLDLGSPAAPLQAKVGPLDKDEDELEQFKQLGMMISPHKIQSEQDFQYLEIANNSPDAERSPDFECEGSPEPPCVSVHKLNTEPVNTSHPDPSWSISTATSPSPLPLPEPDLDLCESPGPCLARYDPCENLNECGSDEDCFGYDSPTSPCMGAHTSIPHNSTSIHVYNSSSDDCLRENDLPSTGNDYGLITREQFRQGGLYGGRDEENGTMSTSLPIDSSVSHHRPVTRQHHKLENGRPSKSVGLGTSVPISTSLPLSSLQEEPYTDNPDEPLLLVGPDEEPQFIGKTKPVPPPRHTTTSPPPHTSQHKHVRSKVLQSTVSSPALLSSDQSRPRSVSFLQCPAGNDHGSFSADYLGCREMDCYISCVNTVAKQLVDSKAVEVITYVSSEKVRLAPPRNAALLFKSFAVKDILAVEMCSKNKRIVGVVVWKKGQCSVPVCHILRCPTTLVSTALYDSLLYQTQHVDEVTAKVKPPPRPDSPSDSSLSSNDSDNTTPLFRDHTPSSRDHTHQPLSPTDLLHKLPAVYVGGASSGKLHSVNEVINKVLTENKPSQSKEVSVLLSLSRVCLVQTSEDGEEVVCESHDTSRIRAIGVCTHDKRYIGYIIKEEGKPLTGHVLRCNSAALMVSLMSFLRQSCQMMVYQRGGSFYDELSADESDDYETSMEGSTGNSGNSESSGIVKRIRSLTMSISNRTVTSPPTPTRPSFLSHTHLRKQLSPANDIPQKKRDAIQNSLFVSSKQFTEEDYARFSVTYVGSASLYLPFSKDSVLDALKAFEENGIAAGQAAVTKNIIDMQVSALSISLTDKSHKLFVTRNYPRKQIGGFCVHPKDSKYFAFATPRPGFPTNMKVHVFVRGEEPSAQIIDALKYWLEIEPTTS